MVLNETQRYLYLYFYFLSIPRSPEDFFPLCFYYQNFAPYIVSLTHVTCLPFSYVLISPLVCQLVDVLMKNCYVQFLEFQVFKNVCLYFLPSLV